MKSFQQRRPIPRIFQKLLNRNGALHNSFKIKDLEKLKYFLGIEVSNSSNGISLCQSKDCLDLLEKSGFICSKHVLTPSNLLIKLYIKIQQLSHFLFAPTMTHFNTTCRILKYLKNHTSMVWHHIS